MSADGPTATKTTKTRPAGPAPRRAPASGAGGAAGAQGDLLGLQRAAGNQAVGGLLHGDRAPAQSEGVCPVCGRRGRGTCPGCGQAFVPAQAAHPAPAPAPAPSPAPPARAADEAPTDAGLRSYLAQSLASGAALEGRLRRTLEASFRQDLSAVRIHADGAAAQAANSIGARAFTLGNNIWFGRGQYRPETRGGQRLLAHELAHTLQQRGQAATIQPSLLVGGATDATEVAADQAADAVLGRRPVPHLGASRPVIRRARVTSIARGSHDDERMVSMDDGTRYRVTRQRRLVPRTSSEPLPPRVRPRFNQDNVWIEITWCRGTRGEVQVGANVPEQARDVLRRLVRTINSGGSSGEVLRELQSTEVTPFVNFDIARSGAWTITGGIEVTVGQQGATGGGGRIGVRRGPVDIDLRGRGEQGGGGSINLDVTVTPGRRDPIFTCPTREKVRIEQQTEYSCRVERDVPARQEPRTRRVPRTDERTRYLYFNYAESTMDMRQSAEEIRLLQTDLGEGFRVSHITAYTSPEGPQAAARRFRGNTQLAEDRARAALEYVRGNCTLTGGESCFVGGSGEAPATGQGELYTVVDPTNGREVEGNELAANAVEEFRNQPAEARHRTPELEADLERRRTPQRQAAVVYPLLRRAVLTLTRTREVEEQYTVDIPAHTTSEATECPTEVRDAAVSNFRLSDATR